MNAGGVAGAQAQAPVTEFFVGTPPYQMYVQRWAPAAGKPARPAPLIMVHGGFHTGVAWTTTPDGKPGWAPWFASEGWTVYVVDWPGSGRSGYWPETPNTGPGHVADALIALIKQTGGPAILMGHSIGGGVSFKLAEREPALVRAIVALAPASVETFNPPVPAVPLDKMQYVAADGARAIFANTELFPKEVFDQYFLTLGSLTPRIRNAALGANDEMKIDRTKLDTWKKVPVLFLAAENDRTVPNVRSTETAGVMGVKHTLLGADWGMPGHGHLYIIERGNQEIAKRIQGWLEENVKR